MVDILTLPSVRPYLGVSRDQILTFETPEGTTRTFRIILYGAYDAQGLIGSEYNGIAVFDEDANEVLLDLEAREDTGYFGPTQSQLDRWGEISDFTWAEFRGFVNSHIRKRKDI